LKIKSTNSSLAKLAGQLIHLPCIIDKQLLGQIPASLLILDSRSFSKNSHVTPTIALAMAMVIQPKNQVLEWQQQHKEEAWK
jgi:hypothetical protein